MFFAYVVYCYINNYITMRIHYIQPEACEIEAGYLFALAASPAESEGSLEGFDNEFPEIQW